MSKFCPKNISYMCNQFKIENIMKIIIIIQIIMGFFINIGLFLFLKLTDFSKIWNQADAKTKQIYVEIYDEEIHRIMLLILLNVFFFYFSVSSIKWRNYLEIQFFIRTSLFSLLLIANRVYDYEEQAKITGWGSLRYLLTFQMVFLIMTNVLYLILYKRIYQGIKNYVFRSIGCFKEKISAYKNYSFFKAYTKFCIMCALFNILNNLYYFIKEQGKIKNERILIDSAIWVFIIFNQLFLGAYSLKYESKRHLLIYSIFALATCIYFGMEIAIITEDFFDNVSNSPYIIDLEKNFGIYGLIFIMRFLYIWSIIMSIYYGFKQMHQHFGKDLFCIELGHTINGGNQKSSSLMREELFSDMQEQAIYLIEQSNSRLINSDLISAKDYTN